MGKLNQAQRPMVVSAQGRFRFQTGMVTATLVAHGVPMEDAFRLSRKLRQDVSGAAEIPTKELRRLIDGLLAEAGVSNECVADPVPSPMARRLAAIGMDAAAIADAMGRGGNLLLPEPFKRRLELLRRIREAEHPILILLAGATGTGKSSLALELGVRLGVPLVVSTDMIREAMRTVLSPDLVPGLHDHSFRGMIQGGSSLSDPRERVLAGFHQQSAQVTVGVRGVIRRAMREGTHIIIEGTHLQPPFEQYMPPGAQAVHAGVMLAVPSKREHRARFPARAARQKLRDASAYLEAFQSVRWIHDDLLSQAEDADVLVLPTGNLDTTVGSALDALASMLPDAMPRPANTRLPVADLGTERTLFLILDGLPDEPQPALGGLTPLDAARTPNFDRLAASGGQGQILTSRHLDEIPHTDVGMWSILAQELPERPIGRGLIEAAGRGITMPPGAVLFRGNLATSAPSSRSLLDRRAGRIESGVEDLIAALRDVPLAGGIRGRVFAAHEHRVVVMLVGAGLSAAISDTDPGAHADPQRVLRAEPLDDTPEAGRTATALRELLARAETHLEGHPLNAARSARGEPPANTIITRGAARVDAVADASVVSVPSAMVAACPAALGVARLMGMTCVTGPSMTGNLDTDLGAKFDAAKPLLADRSLVAIHFKGTDIAAHDRRPVAKRDFIEAVDAALGAFLEAWSEDGPALRVVITADHGTSSASGQHLCGYVPLLVTLWDPDAEGDGRFTEQTATEGALGELAAGELAAMLWGQP